MLFPTPPKVERRELTPDDFADATLLLAPEYVLLPDGLARDQAVVIEKGAFVCVDTLDAVTARYPHLARLDLPGKLLMPGFIDAHHHLTQSFGKALAFGEPSEIYRRIWVPLERYLDDDLLYLSAKLASLEALRGGFTTVCDAGTRAAGNGAAIAAATQDAGIRAVLGLVCNNLTDGVPTQSREHIARAADAHLSRWAHHPMVHPSLAVSVPEAASDDVLALVAALCAESGRVFQTHANEHLASVERSVVARGLRPIEHLNQVGALGPNTLIAHATLVTPSELNLLREHDAAVAYNPVASQWKGNAVAPALQMAALGIRVGLGTDGTRSDGFRLLDAAEASQRLAFGLANGDSSCGNGDLWLAQAHAGSSDALRLNGSTGQIAAQQAADFLLIDIDVPEMTPTWDLGWELVRLANRDQIVAVFVAGTMRLWRGWPLDWDARALMREVDTAAKEVVARAPIQRVHRRREESAAPAVRTARASVPSGAPETREALL